MQKYFLMNQTEDKTKESNSEELVENVDYYFENGLMVLTEHFLKRRGYCCRNGCRHCPYEYRPKDKDKIIL